jgi:hypothetical protein
MTDVAEAGKHEKQPWFAFKVLSRTPLLTFSSSELNRIPLVRLASIAPEVFDVPVGLHLLHISHTIERPNAATNLAATIAQARAALPGHVFVVLTATEMEGYLLADLGVPSLLANGLIFTDERIWKPTPPTMPGLRVYDAIYSARLSPGKRHALGAKIENLLLVYPHALSDSEDIAQARVKEILPAAFFANHQLGGGKYRIFGIAEMVRLLGHAQVGLCLSSIEGCMRASMEYLLCGLPVVSTRSIGGRDRYFLGGYCRQVEDDADAVAGAVRELRGLGLDRRRIREHVAELLAFDRYNFLTNVNKLAKTVLGQEGILPAIDPFIGSIEKFVSLDSIVEDLRKKCGLAPTVAGDGIQKG